MPKFSAFTPLGLLKLTAAPSQARVIFNAKVSALGSQAGKLPAYAKTEVGSRLGAKLYAEAIREAVIRMLARRAAEADLPSRIHPEMVPIREREHGIVPVSDATFYQRKRALVAAYRLPLGGSRFNIEITLRALLGSGFVYYRTFDPAADTRVLYPPAIGDSPMNLKSADVPRVIVTLDSTPSPDGPIPGISMPDAATPQKVYYTPVTPKPTGTIPVLLGGEDLVVEPRNPARCERVRITEVGADAGVPWFKAAFAQAHEPGSFGTTQPFPLWVSVQRFALIVVKPAVAADAGLLASIHRVMRTLARGVSTWSIAESTSLTTAGPFTLGVSPLGSTTISTTTFPFLPMP